MEVEKANLWSYINNLGLHGADGGTRTRTIKDQGILSPWRLPVPPRPHRARLADCRRGSNCARNKAGVLSDQLALRRARISLPGLK